MKHHLRWYAVASLGALMGCQSKSDPAVTQPDTQPAGSAVTVTEPIAKPTHATANIDRPVLVVPAADGSFEAPVPPASKTEDPQILVARQAFTELTSPGITAEEWETKHEKLLTLGASSVPVLAEALASEQPLARETAASMLVLLGPEASGATTELRAALHDSSLFVRANAAAALVLIPGEQEVSIPILVELLRSQDPQLRQMAAMNLAVVGPEASAHVEQLTQVLQHERSPEVLAPVVQLLGRIGAPATPSIPKLQQIAFEHSQLKDEVTTAIGQIQTLR